MAVYAAHLTRTLQGTPSVFQVVAQEALGATVKPALRKIVEYLSATHPSRCEWLLRWYDELYLVFDCLLQYHYLKHYAASFSERFYGLQRVTSRSGALGSARLSPARELASLAALAVLPYLAGRAGGVARRWREQADEGRLGKSPSDRARLAFIRLYALTYTIASLARLATLARYTRGAARAPDPVLAMMGLRLVRAEGGADEEEGGWTELARALLAGRFGSAALTFPMLGSLLLRGVEYGAFLVQFLRHWQSHGGRAPGAAPPHPPHRDENAVRWKNKCPICLRTWRIPTVLPVSGYVFCYSCIMRHVRAHGTCPVTAVPADERRLLRMYVD